MNRKKLTEIILRNWPAKMLSLALAVFLFYFYRINTTELQYMNLPLIIDMNGGFTAVEALPSEARLTLRGSSENLSLLKEEDFYVYVDFSNAVKAGSYRGAVKIKKSGNALYADPLEVRVLPNEISVKIEEKLIKTLNVVPSFQGFPATNYELSSFTVVPEKLSVEGPVSVIGKIKSLKTENISINGRSKNFTVSVDIVGTSSVVNFLGAGQVKVSGNIEKNLILKNITPVEIILLNTKDTLFYSMEITSGSVKIEGDRGTVEKINKLNSLLKVNMSDIGEPGVYDMPLLVVLPEVDGEMNLIGYTPETIKINVSVQEPGGL